MKVASIFVYLVGTVAVFALGRLVGGAWGGFVSAWLWGVGVSVALEFDRRVVWPLLVGIAGLIGLYLASFPKGFEVAWWAKLLLSLAFVTPLVAGRAIRRYLLHPAASHQP